MEEKSMKVFKFFPLFGLMNEPGAPIDDFDFMLERAKLAGVKSMIITGGSLKESRDALKLAKEKGKSGATLTL